MSKFVAAGVRATASAGQGQRGLDRLGVIGGDGRHVDLLARVRRAVQAQLGRPHDRPVCAECHWGQGRLVNLPIRLGYRANTRTLLRCSPRLYELSA